MVDSVDCNGVCRKRNFRSRLGNRLFSGDNWVTNYEDDGCASMSYYVQYDLHKKMECGKFVGHGFVKEMHGSSFNTNYISQHGLNTPVLVKCKTNLGLRVPNNRFTVNHVTRCVGPNRIIDVIDVNTQTNVQMTMQDYRTYYNNRHVNSKQLLNVISLEFSNTDLDELVVPPKVVRDIDWIDQYWPKFLKKRQSEGTNVMKHMMYPKVQKYCLMSVKGCYTDFHIDFGGTSVWYHILKGEKIFWLIPPTQENLELYKKWVLCDRRLTKETCYTFLGDIVERCERVVLKPGQTFFIPSGWLHAVYTTKHSLVFGGNFLHLYSVETQIVASKMEDTIRVSKKFRYPFFPEIHLYVLQHLVNEFNKMLNPLDGANNLIFENIVVENNCDGNNNVDFFSNRKVFLLRNITTILHYFSNMCDIRKHIPAHLDNSTFFTDLKVLKENCDRFFGGDARAVRGLSRLLLSVKCVMAKLIETKILDGSYFNDSEVQESERYVNEKVVKKCKTITIKDVDIRKKQKNRRRRTRCRKCVTCKKDDCGICTYCKDMIKYGGNGRAKQSCILRQCLQPVLPISSVCTVCEEGCHPLFLHKTVGSVSKTVAGGSDGLLHIRDTLMECSVCYEIVHPKCLFGELSDHNGYNMDVNVNDDLPNSWKCPKCFVNTDKHVFNKQRSFRGRCKRYNKTPDIIDNLNKNDRNFKTMGFGSGFVSGNGEIRVFETDSMIGSRDLASSMNVGNNTTFINGDRDIFETELQLTREAISSDVVHQLM